MFGLISHFLIGPFVRLDKLGSGYDWLVGYAVNHNDDDEDDNADHECNDDDNEEEDEIDLVANDIFYED